MATPTTSARIRRGRAAARAVLTTSSGRRVGDAAAESGFFIALAVLPMMLTTTALLRAVRPLLGRDARPGVEHGLARMLRIVLSSRGGTAADAAQRLLTGTTGGLLTLGTAVSLLLVARAMRSIGTGVAAAARDDPVAPSYPREWAAAFALAAVGVVLTAVIMAMVAVGPLLGHTRDIATGADRNVQIVWAVLRWPAGLAAIFVLVLLVHGVGLRGTGQSNVRRPALVGAAVATLGAVAASVLLPVYVHVASQVSPTLGTLGGGLILLVWSYLLALSVLVGAQVRTLLGRPAAGLDQSGSIHS